MRDTRVKMGKTFVGAVLAGMSIGLGGVIFLSLDNRAVGAALFTVGLFTVCTMGFDLYTGKVCYVFDNDAAYAKNLPVIWLGNLCGTALTALFAGMTRISGIAEKASAICAAKLDDGLVSLFFLGVLCNIFIYIAVEEYKNNPHELGKYLSLFFGVMGFILCGTEHCVADMFYFWMSGAWSGQAILRILVITLGNSAGGVLIPLTRKYINN